MSPRAVKTFQAKRRAAGWVKATVWLSPASQTNIAELQNRAAEDGESAARDAVIAYALEVAFRSN